MCLFLKRENTLQLNKPNKTKCKVFIILLASDLFCINWEKLKCVFLFIPNTTMCSPTYRPCFFHLSKSSVSSTLDADGVKDPAATDSHFISTQYIISFIYIQEQGGLRKLSELHCGRGVGRLESEVKGCCWWSSGRRAGSWRQRPWTGLAAEQRQSLACTKRGLWYRQTDTQTHRTTISRSRGKRW